MSTKELLHALDQADLIKLYQAKKFSEQASRSQHSLFSFKRIIALYNELAAKYKVDFEQIMSLSLEIDENTYLSSIA